MNEWGLANTHCGWHGPCTQVMSKVFLMFDKNIFLFNMRNTMSKSAPPLPESLARQLETLGALLRQRRKSLKVNATAAAESAGISRVTVHRIEKGEPSVTMGAWARLGAALGLSLAVQEPSAPQASPHDPSAWVPVQIALAEYPQLQSLAWQVHGLETLTPLEAFDIYERNARHLDMQAMQPEERGLWQALQAAFAGRSAGV